MLIQTTRFGAVEVNENDVLVFADGLLGFSQHKKFVLLDDPNDEIFAWLQSTEQPGLAFPVLEPEIFASANYKVNLSRYDYEALQMKDMTKAKVMSIITIPNDVTQMTANLKAPVIINIKERIGKQVVLQENDYQIKFAVFSELQKRVVQNPQARLKTHASEWGVAVRVHTKPAATQGVHTPEVTN